MLGLDPATLISRVLILFIALTFHEFAHAWAAYRFGDDTARLNGRLTLNPLAHLDPIGSLMLLIAGFGWAKPVPINPYALLKRSPNGVAWVSLAGPLSNFLLAVLAAIPLRFHWVAVTYGNGSFPTLFSFLVEFMFINLALAFFNLLPIAPLDGEKIMITVLPPVLARGLAKVSVYGPIILLGLIMLGRFSSLDFFGAVMFPTINNVSLFLLGG
jgi:Zn-dependent protease